MNRRHLYYLLLALLVAIVLFARFRYLDVPFERDEGEYAYAGQLILEGLPPYGEVYNMKWPGTYVMYAFIMFLFGQTVTAVHLGLLIINLITAFFLFKIGRHLLGRLAGMVAAVSFMLLSVGPEVQGAFANTEHFVLVFAMPGIWLLLKALQKETNSPLFWSGVLLSIAMIMKQHGIMFGAFGGIYLVWILWKREESRAVLTRRSGIYILGLLTPLLLMLVWLTMAGVFDKFWWFTIEYAQTYISHHEWGEVWSRFWYKFGTVYQHNVALWIWVPMALILSVIYQRRTAFMLLLALASLIAVSIGFQYRPHYFVLMLPASALLIAYTFHQLRGSEANVVRNNVVMAAFLLSSGWYLLQQKDYFFTMDSKEMILSVYFHSPFLEAVAAGEHIKANSTKDARIAVIGAEPEVFFYAQRKSATSYIYIYPLLEDQPYAHDMVDEFIYQIESNAPQYLIMSHAGGTWWGNDSTKGRILTWYDHYQAEHYELDWIFGLNWQTKELKQFSHRDSIQDKSIWYYYTEVYKRK